VARLSVYGESGSFSLFLNKTLKTRKQIGAENTNSSSLGILNNRQLKNHFMARGQKSGN
jgi:hypothetical protein